MRHFCFVVKLHNQIVRKIFVWIFPLSIEMPADAVFGGGVGVGEEGYLLFIHTHTLTPNSIAFEELYASCYFDNFCT